jgi:hypothetical protein
MANLDGSFGFVIGESRVPRILDLLASDLATRVIPICGHRSRKASIGRYRTTSRPQSGAAS